MVRINFDVIPVDGEWMVKIDGDSGEWRFDRKADAIHSAVAAARRHWKDSGRCTGVRILRATGTWKRECLFGRAPPGTADRASMPPPMAAP